LVEIEGVMVGFIGVLPVPNTGEQTRNGGTRVRKIGERRRVLGGVEDVVTVGHERELMVVEEELSTHLTRALALKTSESDEHPLPLSSVLL
jgi:hypothetical protein